MNTHLNDMTKKEEVMNAVRHYINGAKSGNTAEMKISFHEDATIFGYLGQDLIAGSIQHLYDFNNQNGAAPNLKEEFTLIEIAGNTAAVRLDLYDWTGFRFTDFLNLIKINDQWKIVNKIFYHHT